MTNPIILAHSLDSDQPGRGMQRMMQYEELYLYLRYTKYIGGI